MGAEADRPRLRSTAIPYHLVMRLYLGIDGGQSSTTALIGDDTGQVIGATNRLGEEASERPVHFQEIFATLYHNLGIDSNHVTLVDPTGRPQYLVTRPAISELV